MEIQEHMPANITQEFIDMIALPGDNGKQLKYLFVMPRFIDNEQNRYFMPYGLCLVTSALKASGRLVYTLNLNYKDKSYELLAETIMKYNIDVVLTGGLSGHYQLIKEILDVVKKTNPAVITCVGGGIMTADPQASIQALMNVDYGMYGEGEITVNELAYALENGINPGTVNGVVSRDGRMGGERLPIENLDIIPFPDYEGFEFNLVQQEDKRQLRVTLREDAISVAVARSCPYHCTFCFHTCANKYRKRSFENISKELDWIREKYPSVKLVQFIDDLFSSDREFLKKLADYMMKYDLEYQFFQRVDVVSKEMMQLLKESGCKHVFFGVESGDNRILKSMQKRITIEQVERAFDLALEAGVNVRGFIIFGDPEETPETIATTINWWKSHPQYNILLDWILTFPGTKLYKDACERGLITDRVKYLQCNDLSEMQLNLTKMSDDTYWKMVDKVTLFQILLSNGVDIDFNHMDRVVHKLKEYLDELADTHKVAIWPAKYDIVTLLYNISPKFIKSENVYFVNEDPYNRYVAGCSRYNKPIHIPEEFLPNSEIDTVFYALGSRAKGDLVIAEIKSDVEEKYTSIKKFINIADCI